jgi:CheY-like chemotaxis protein
VANVLVVDDDPAVRTTIRLVLERNGHRVSVAADGRAGLAALAAGGIDLMFVDLFMPGMDGMETLREVRKHQADLPVIVMSGTSLGGPGQEVPDFLAMAVKLGAVRSIQKPFKPRDIIDGVRASLGDAATAGATGQLLSEKTMLKP